MVKLSALAGDAVAVPAAAVMPASTAAAPKRAEPEITFVTTAPQVVRPKGMVKSPTYVGRDGIDRGCNRQHFSDFSHRILRWWKCPPFKPGSSCDSPRQRRTLSYVAN